MQLDALAIHAALKQAILKLRFHRQRLGEPEADTHEQQREGEAGEAPREAVRLLPPLALAQEARGHASSCAIGSNAAVRTSIRRTTGAWSRIATRSSGDAA